MDDLDEELFDHVCGRIAAIEGALNFLIKFKGLNAVIANHLEGAEEIVTGPRFCEGYAMVVEDIKANGEGRLPVDQRLMHQ